MQGHVVIVYATLAKMDTTEYLLATAITGGLYPWLNVCSYHWRHWREQLQRIWDEPWLHIYHVIAWISMTSFTVIPDKQLGTNYVVWLGDIGYHSNLSFNTSEKLIQLKMWQEKATQLCKWAEPVIWNILWVWHYWSDNFLLVSI